MKINIFIDKAKRLLLPRYKRVDITLPNDVKNMLVRTAAVRGISIDYLVEEIISEHIQGL